MLQDGKILCDSCHKPITRMTAAPAEGWPQMHNVCSSCFGELQKQAVPRG